MSGGAEKQEREEEKRSGKEQGKQESKDWCDEREREPSQEIEDETELLEEQKKKWSMWLQKEWHSKREREREKQEKEREREKEEKERGIQSNFRNVEGIPTKPKGS